MESTSALVLQHGPAGPPGVLGEWLDERGIPHDIHNAWADPLPPNPAAFSFVVSLGSEHSAAAVDPDWVVLEIDLLRRAVDGGVPVLGLCFGGQALAVALGASVGQAKTPEIGWMQIETDDPELVAPGPWLEFHFEVFEVPEGARELARSEAGPQAFSFGPHLGTQFHPEVTPEVVDEWARLDAARIAPLGVDRRELLAQGRRVEAEARANAFRLFDRWLDGASGVG